MIVDLCIIHGAEPSAAPQTGLDFPANTGVPGDTIRFTLSGANWPASVPFSMLWRIYPRAQASGYNTTFFNGSTDSPFQSNHQYYGCHPYPENFGAGPNRNWEISIEGNDDIVDDNGNSTLVTGFTGRWYQQAVTAAVVDTDEVLVTFYWDLETASTRVITYTTATNFTGKSTGSAPGLTFGDAPWAPGDEMLNGILRGVQVFQLTLNLTQIGTLRASQTDAEALSAASGLGVSHWYLNMNPTPSNINDQSGNGRNPAWLNANRPTLWQG